MNDAEVKQLCLDISNAAIALFDVIEEQGVDAPLDDLQNVIKLNDIISPVEELRAYYFRRNIMRMLALGVDPQDLIRLSGEDNGTNR
jgi:hypothetical protein